jgi:AcrR family transcriptional regulator
VQWFPDRQEGTDPVASTTAARKPESDQRPSGGRSLDATRDAALRAAALELLAEIGYDRLTIDAVAARARASKTTIYRRWSGKAELIVDALNTEFGPLATVDTGSLASDLESIASGAVGSDNEFKSLIMIGLITALARDPDLRRVVRQRLIDPRAAGLKAVLERAMRRGEIPKNRNPDMLVSVFPALMLHHLLIEGEIPDAAYTQRLIHEVIIPLATAPTTSPARTRSRR